MELGYPSGHLMTLMNFKRDFDSNFIQLHQDINGFAFQNLNRVITAESYKTYMETDKDTDRGEAKETYRNILDETLSRFVFNVLFVMNFNK